MRTKGTGLFAVLACVGLLLLPLLLVAGCGETAVKDKVSKPGEYSGYSQPEYASWETTSQYVPMRDGTRIAVDVYRPTEGPEGKLPAVLIMTPYHRASVKDGEVVDLMTDPESAYRTIVSYGYNIVCADIRGTGASYGSRFAIFGPEEVSDGNDLVDWIAAQEWCDGNVGMMGQSYLGIIQLMNASNMNPHLKCIIPRYALMEMYDFVFPGGIYNFNFVEVYNLGMRLLNSNVAMPAVDIYPSKPVDEDTDGNMLAEASLEHEGNSDLVMIAEQYENVFRDSQMETPEGDTVGFDLFCPAGYLEEIQASEVAIYNMGGWLDCFLMDTVTLQQTLSNESRCLIGNYDHTQGFEGTAIECVRFFDRYLKGIENGIDEEQPYYVYTTGSEEWKEYEVWPPAGAEPEPYYLKSGGGLSLEEPEEEEPVGAYEVDYTTSSGKKTRWLAMTGEPSEYEDRAEEDEKCLTYTTEPLAQDTELSGFPVLTLYVSSTATDGDFFAYLEDVGEDGYAQYKSEGQLRASLRKLGERPWLPDLPYHPCNQADVQPLVPGEKAELTIVLFPVSHVFKKGHSIRISLAGADEDNFRTPQLDPPPTWTVYGGSHVDLPVIP